LFKVKGDENVIAYTNMSEVKGVVYIIVYSDVSMLQVEEISIAFCDMWLSYILREMLLYRVMGFWCPGRGKFLCRVICVWVPRSG